MPVNTITRENLAGLIPTTVSREILQGVVSESTVLTNFRRLPNMSSKTHKINVLDALPVAYWVNGDTGIKQTTNMAWADKTITAEEVAVIVPIAEAVLDDADYDIWGEVRPRLVEAFGKVIDQAILFGVNKPASWRDDIVSTATAAGAVVTATADVYQDIMGEGGVISKVEESGFMPTAAMSAVSMRAKLRGLTDSNGRPIFKTDMQGATQYALDGIPMFFPMNGAYDPAKAAMIVGDFTQAVYAVRQDITFKIFTEGVVQDPSDKSIAYNLMQNDMIALRAVMRLGWQIANPINAYQPDESKRSPFSIYKFAESGASENP